MTVSSSRGAPSGLAAPRLDVESADAAPWSDPTPAGARRRVPPWVVDLAVALVVIGSGFAPIGGPGGAQHVVVQPPDLRAVPVLLVAALILPTRRRWPVAALVASVVIACAAAVAGLSTAAFVIPVAVAVFAITLHRPRRISLPFVIGAAVLLPLAGLATTVPADFSPTEFLSARAVQAAAVVAAAAGLGSAARARRATIAAITGRAQRAEQTRESEARRRVAEDRLQIARDLHDLVAHQIAVINLQAGVASRGLRDRPDEAEQALAAIREAARSVITEIGDLLALLRTTGADATPAATRAGLHRLDALVALFEQSGLRVQLAVEPGATDVPDAVGVVAYQVIQEGLTNAHKHGADHAVRLAVTTRDETLVVSIENRSATSMRRVRPGNGLTGMRERVAAAGGRMHAEQDPADRFRLTVELPAAPVPQPTPATGPDAADGPAAPSPSVHVP